MAWKEEDDDGDSIEYFRNYQYNFIKDDYINSYQSSDELLDDGYAHDDGFSGLVGNREVNQSDKLLQETLEKMLTDELSKLHEKDFGPKEWSIFAKVALAFVYIAIIITAIIGNTIVILVVTRNHKMQSVTNRFLLSLAISDLCMAIFNMPVTLVFYIRHEWVLGEFLCRFASYMQGVFIVASIFTLTAVAIDRYYAILHPLKVRHIHTRTRAIIVITTIWVVSMLLVSPQVSIQRLGEALRIDLKSNHPIRIIKLCEEHFKSRTTEIVYTLLVYAFIYILPVIIMTSTYGAIAIHLWRRQPIGELPTSSRKHLRHYVETKSILRMIITIVLFFVVAWMPFFSGQLFLMFHRQTNLTFEIMAILQLIGYSNTCVNPVVYCFLNEKFRSCVKALFHSIGRSGSMRIRRLSSVSTKLPVSTETSNGKTKFEINERCSGS